jgi:hypothetical protein
MKDTPARTGFAEAACLWGADIILLASFYARARSTSWFSLRLFDVACHKAADVRPRLCLHWILRKHSENFPRHQNHHPRQNNLMLVKGISVILTVYHRSYSANRPQANNSETHVHSQGIERHLWTRCLYGSKTKERITAPPYVFCGPVSGNTTGKNRKGFVKRGQEFPYSSFNILMETEYN